MNGKKLRLGLIGKDVSKSLSERIHTFILKEWGIECVYERFSVSAEEFDGAIKTLMREYDGFNITIPYKKEVSAYLRAVEDGARACDSVNTVVTATGTGYNTDGTGFLLMLETAGIKVQGKKVLVLGVGGSGRSSALALKNAGASVWAYRRNAQALLEICSKIGVFPCENPEVGGFDIVVNCTGVGMHDTEGVSPVSQKAFQGASFAVDLIYTPQKSAFLQTAEKAGVAVLNGESMLFYQAYYADCLYTEKTPSVSEAYELYEKYKRSSL